ncbi:MAG: DNA/RNA non-specific endonuclease [Muribaculaceae bacterium]|nr:DNA/RNA non-specific endonuclease [Muribaculaceae bacterium]
MIKRLYLIATLACAALATHAVTKTAVFDFSSPEALAQLGLPTPTSSSPTYLRDNITVGDITFVPGSSSPRSTYYQGQYTFYTTKNNNFSFQAGDGATITRVDFRGFYEKQNFTASPAGFDTGNTFWSGSTSKVTFTGTSGNSLYSMTVTYEMEDQQEFSSLDVNRDGEVTGSDVTAVYNYLLNNNTTYLATSDVNGDGEVTGSDVTAIYNYLLFGIEPSSPVPMPTFSHPSGTVFNTPTVVTVTGPAGSRIYVTTNGSTPSTTNYEDNAYDKIDITVGFNMTLKAIAILDGQSSAVATAIYTLEVVVDNNQNRNSLSSYYNASKYMYRLEWPRIKENGNQTWLAKSESEYGLALEMEWDNSKIANRFTCYYMDENNTAQNVSRHDSFKEDPEIPSAYRSKLSDYSGSGYARGHLCPSADRRASDDQQALTYYLSNMQPQWQKHNEAQWANLEGDVRKWAARCDTLYVVKAATIDDITLNNVTESGVYSTTYNGTYYSDLKCNGRLLVAKYYYMALLAFNKSTNTYQAIGIWTKHYNAGTTGASGSGSYDWPIINKENAQYISIDELEKRTGIDFFCNLPDDIEDQVEASFNTSYWSSGAALNR